MRAWLFQTTVHKRRHGDKAPWSVGYYDPNGKKKSRTIGAKSNAEKFARKIEGQLASGTYEDRSRATWGEFTAEYESKALATMGGVNRELTQIALNHFARIIKPRLMRGIDTKAVDEYVAARRAEKMRGGKPHKDGKIPAPATINRELRYLRCAFRKAVRWKYLAQCPEFTFLREPGKLPTYVTPEHFAAIYKTCDVATFPAEQAYMAADWWRALLVVAYMTGWRIGQILALKWADVDLDAGTALSRAADNKGKRDQLLPLHPLVVDHLRRLKGFSPVVFGCPVDQRGLYDPLNAIQDAAKVRPTHGKRYYAFHDFRRAFATMNAERLTADALQALMQHKSYSTTQRYINMARQLDQAVAAVFVPDVSLSTATG